MRKFYVVLSLIVLSLLALMYLLNTSRVSSERFEVLSADGALSCSNLYVKIVIRDRLGKPISIDKVNVGGKEIVIRNTGSGFNGSTYVRIEFEENFFGDVFINIIELNTTRQTGEYVSLEFYTREGVSQKASVKITRYSCVEYLDIKISEISYVGVWKIVFKIRNERDQSSTIDQVLINGKTPDKAGASLSLSYPMTFSPGEEKILTITLITGYSPGDLVEIRFHTILGNEYPIMLTLK